MKPFADDDASQAIGGLTVENGTTRIAVYGRLDIGRDKAGLRRAKKLKALIDAMVEALEAVEDLPAKAAEAVDPPTRVANPFA